MSLLAEEERDGLPLVNALREDVRRWRASGWERANLTTKPLLRHCVAALGRAQGRRARRVGSPARSRARAGKPSGKGGRAAGLEWLRTGGDRAFASARGCATMRGLAYEYCHQNR